ncbi:uncharacterized protein LOC142987863 [Anticarsia gemmatalis]|uniref:uncharacterized protein LOC142987863 n=1 Tax=Anticarsia gemmatalis TaxID=129554 RepID=UPI003F768F5F
MSSSPVPQVLSGHGCFGRYLWKVARREPTAECHHCGAEEDTAAHTLSDCAAWTTQRARLVEVVGADLSLPAVVRAIACDASAWRAMITFCQEVISRKEEAERARENDPLAAQMRRRRVGRRRLAHDRRMPP